VFHLFGEFYFFLVLAKGKKGRERGGRRGRERGEKRERKGREEGEKGGRRGRERGGRRGTSEFVNEGIPPPLVGGVHVTGGFTPQFDGDTFVSILVHLGHRKVFVPFSCKDRPAHKVSKQHCRIIIEREGRRKNRKGRRDRREKYTLRLHP
jgi:hypothetical protein